MIRLCHGLLRFSGSCQFSGFVRPCVQVCVESNPSAAFLLAFVALAEFDHLVLLLLLLFGHRFFPALQYELSDAVKHLTDTNTEQHISTTTLTHLKKTNRAFVYICQDFNHSFSWRANNNAHMDGTVLHRLRIF